MILSHIMFAVFALLQVADVWTTNYIVSRGIGYEANKVMAYAIKTIGLLPGLLIPKLAMLALVFVFILHVAYGEYILGLLIFLYAYVIANNIKVIQRDAA